VCIVVPCYNEEAVLENTVRELLALLEQQSQDGRCNADSLLLFVDDGSTDLTWSLIEEAARCNPGRVAGLRLSTNVGHQRALLAGLLTAPGDVLRSIDADLQDDLAVIPQMLDLYRAGNDLVYGVRDRCDSDTMSKRFTAETCYRVMRWMGVDLVHNQADFRLMSRRAVEALRQYEEVNLFLRGIVRLIGFRSAEMFYERRARHAAVTHYPLARCSRWPPKA
jgi:glycosyltransferase involved in cell wall biosynthesis